MHKRHAVTLIELLVAIGILSVLMALLLPAVQKVRDAAQRTQSVNKQKQIILGCHSFAAAHDDNLPVDRPGKWADVALMVDLALHLGIHPALAPNPQPESDLLGTRVPLFVSPADPTVWMWRTDTRGNPFETHLPASVVSYAYNVTVFSTVRPPSLRTTFRDGTASTIAFGEHFSRCANVDFAWGGRVRDTLSYNSGRAPYFGGISNGMTAATAKAEQYDEYKAALTFQVQPRIDPLAFNAGTPQPTGWLSGRAPCDPSLAQTPHAAGMVTSFADGSVRTLRPDVSPAVYWAAITPAGGETGGYL